MKLTASGEDIQENSFLRTLRDTGARVDAVCHLRIDDIKDDHVILRAEWSKARIETLAPITEETSKTLRDYIVREHPADWLFPGENGQPWSRQKAYRVVARAAKRAGISINIHPHMFRHWRALAYRRQGTETDVVVNAMGWTDSDQYNKRYGKRTGQETLKEARKAISSTTQPLAIPEAIERLAGLLDAGKIDRETFQAGLLILGKKDDKKDLPGYQ